MHGDGSARERPVRGSSSRIRRSDTKLGILAGIVFLTLLVSTVGCGATGQPYGAVTPAEPSSAENVAPLRPGDAVAVRLSREPEAGGQFAVDEGGIVSLPHLGNRTVRDVPPESLRASLVAEYESLFRNQAIEVRLLRRVRVIGYVQRPGLYHVDATMTLADVIADAGGATHDGRLEDTYILRGVDVVEVDMRLTGGGFETLRSGDQIVVPPKGWLSRNSAVIVGSLISALGFLVGAAAFR